MELNWKHSGFSSRQVSAVCKRLAPFIANLRTRPSDFSYSQPESSIALPFDFRFAKASKQLADKFKHCKLIVVIGIGGSNLGSQAICEALKGKQFNTFSEKKLFWADSIDDANLREIKKAMRSVSASKTVLVLISKSGKTTETIANFQLLYRKGNNVVVISDSGSPLHKFVQLRCFHFLPVPSNVGGRYSVFSNVGLFPLALMGVDVDALLRGAAKGTRNTFEVNWKRSPAMLMAALLCLHRKNGVRINEQFFFSSKLEALGKWYRQLLGESIGKEKNLAGKKVNEGITPNVALAVDLHSQAQLYFGGPRDRFFTIVIAKERLGYPIPKFAFLDNVVPAIQGKTTGEVSNAISIGFKRALAESNRPFVEVELDFTKPEEALGEFMQVQMIQVILLARLLGVNAFDQPNVEDYKKETKRQLMYKR